MQNCQGSNSKSDNTTRSEDKHGNFCSTLTSVQGSRECWWLSREGDSTQAELSNCYELSSSHNIEPASANVFAKLLQKDNCWSKQDTTDSRKLLSPFLILCAMWYFPQFFWKTLDNWHNVTPWHVLTVSYLHQKVRACLISPSAAAQKSLPSLTCCSAQTDHMCCAQGLVEDWR